VRNLFIKKEQFNICIEKSIYLDALKLFLMMQVFIGHLLAISVSSFPALDLSNVSDLIAAALKIIFRFGPESAYIFIFLSGFFVGGKLIHHFVNKEAMPVNVFFLNRLRRIYPTLIAAIILTAIFDYLGMHFFQYDYNFPLFGQLDAVNRLSFYNLIGNILSLHPLLVDSYGSNGPLWTLGYIVQFYVFGLVIYLLFSRVKYAVSLLLLLLLFSFMLFVRLEWGLCFILWCIGAICKEYSFVKVSFVKGISGSIAVFILANFLKTDFSILLCLLTGVLFIESIRGGVPIKSTEKIKSYVSSLSHYTFLVYALHLPVCFFVYSTFSNIFKSFSFGYLIYMALMLIIISIVSYVTLFILRRLNYA
jgi:peptidoglycan/LPS O-acetylase OafA/YrhL